MYGPCNICGKMFSNLSMGGPYMCPACDCGIPPNQDINSSPFFMPPNPDTQLLNICESLKVSLNEVSIKLDAILEEIKRRY